MDELFAQLQELKTIPNIVWEIINSFNHPQLDFTTLAEQICREPALTAKILRIANSAFYGLPRQVGSIQDAVVILGLNSVRNLALAASLTDQKPDLEGFDSVQ